MNANGMGTRCLPDGPDEHPRRRNSSVESLERQRSFIDFTLSSLMRRKGQNAAVLVVYSLVVFVLSSVVFFSGSMRREAESVLSEAPEMVVQRTMAGRHDLVPIEYVPLIEGIQGVQSVAPRLWGYYFHPASLSNYTVIVPADFPYADDQVVIGSGVRRTWGTIVDQELFFKAHDGELLRLKMADALDGRTEIVTADLILASERTFRRLFGVPDAFATDLAVKIRNPREYNTIKEKIMRRLLDARPITREEILRTYAALFDWRSGYLIAILSVSLLSFFIFAWDKASGLSAAERREIGILKGLGWETSDILLMKFWEGAIISLTAFAVGVILGYVHVFFASASLFEHAMKGWSTLFPSFTLRPVINVFQVSILFFLTVVPYSLLTIIPTWGVSVTDPDAVMRQ
ncbi:MAG: ABC transporter permease [Thermodesulfobacteriota bacterium]